MHKNVFKIFTLGVCLLATIGVPKSVLADQPVMNEAPRWAGGWGFQVREEYRSADTRIHNDSEIENPLGLERRVHTTWLEGVYTYDRSKRITIKIPWVDQRRVANIDGLRTKQNDRGLGDIVIGTPLRKYTNYRAWTSNISFTPSIRIPSGKTSGDYPIGDGSTDLGLSLSYSAESTKWFGSIDAFHWFNNDGTRGQHQGDETGLDITIGKILFTNGKDSSGAQLQFDFGARYKDEGTSISGNNAGARITAGPAFVYFRGPMIMRIVYNIPVYEYALDNTISYGHQIDAGIGWAF